MTFRLLSELERPGSCVKIFILSNLAVVKTRSQGTL
jgi:hypothetical protein